MTRCLESPRVQRRPATELSLIEAGTDWGVAPTLALSPPLQRVEGRDSERPRTRAQGRKPAPRRTMYHSAECVSSVSGRLSQSDIEVTPFSLLLPA